MISAAVIGDTDFRALVACEPVCTRCAVYLRIQHGLDQRPELEAISPKMGFTQLLLRKRKAIPLPARAAVIELLAGKSLDPFVRLWIATRPTVLSSRTLRRFANKLAALAYAPLQNFPTALEAVKAMRTSALDVARKFAVETEEAFALVVGRPLRRSEQAACKALYTAMYDVPYEAVTTSLGWLIDAREMFEFSEGHMIQVCSRRLRVVCERLVEMAKLRGNDGSFT
jgi:hypothetical protein